MTRATIEKVKSLPISDTTARSIACLCALEDIYGTVCDILESLYGEAQVDAMAEEILSEPYLRVREAILKLMTEAISEGLTFSDITIY